MKKLIALSVAALFLAVTGSVFAEDQATCPAGTNLQLIGDIKTGATVFGEATPTQAGPTVTTAGAKVRRIIGRCGGTACVVGIADVDTAAAAVAADYKFEVGAPANTVFDLEFESGFQFNNGITVTDSTTNVAQVALYECR